MERMGLVYAFQVLYIILLELIGHESYILTVPNVSSVSSYKLAFPTTSHFVLQNKTSSMQLI